MGATEVGRRESSHQFTLVSQFDEAVWVFLLPRQAPGQAKSSRRRGSVDCITATKLQSEFKTAAKHLYGLVCCPRHGESSLQPHSGAADRCRSFTRLCPDLNRQAASAAITACQRARGLPFLNSGDHRFLERTGRLYIGVGRRAVVPSTLFVSSDSAAPFNGKIARSR